MEGDLKTRRPILPVAREGELTGLVRGPQGRRLVSKTGRGRFESFASRHAPLVEGLRRRPVKAETAGSNPCRVLHREVGESGRPLLPWKQAIVRSNRAFPTTPASFSSRTPRSERGDRGATPWVGAK